MPNNITHYELEEFLTEETKQKLLHIATNLKDEDWTVHTSTLTGKPSVLHYFDLKMKFNGRSCYLLMIRPNAIQDWHTDGGKRKTALIYPLSDNYAPCKFEKGETTAPVLLNTQTYHAVFNNDTKRINLNISFEEDIDTVFDQIKKEKYELHRDSITHINSI